MDGISGDFGALVSEEALSLEVRWIRSGALAASMIDWFSPFVGELESREDIYFVGRQMHGLSVKIRGGALLDIKVARGSEPVLDVAGRARGRVQAWTKWSFPVPLVPETTLESPDWVRVDKRRRIGRFSLEDGEAIFDPSASDKGTTCAVEVTEVMKGERSSWTIGFEAVGEPDTLREAIETVAASVFRDPLPDGLELGAADSLSYSDWLRPSDLG